MRKQGLKWGRVALVGDLALGLGLALQPSTSDCGRDPASFLDHFKQCA